MWKSQRRCQSGGPRKQVPSHCFQKENTVEWKQFLGDEYKYTEESVSSSDVTKGLSHGYTAYTELRIVKITDECSELTTVLHICALTNTSTSVHTPFWRHVSIFIYYNSLQMIVCRVFYYTRRHKLVLKCWTRLGWLGFTSIIIWKPHEI
jgi:hypothetical protein